MRHLSVVFTFVAFVTCIFLLGEMQGFSWGYWAAQQVDIAKLERSSFVTHGTNAIDPIRSSYLIAALSCLAIVLTYVKDKGIHRLTLISTMVAIAILCRGIYYKYLVLSSNNSELFVNPYFKWIESTVLYDWLCLATLIAAFLAQSLRIYSNWSTRSEGS